MPRVASVLFDLDGTLIDSAPDLAGAANAVRQARGLSPLPLATLRPMVGAGARGMLGLAMGVAPGEAGYDALRDEFLERYAGRCLHETAVFAGMLDVLDALDRAGLPWGIVTNKAMRFAEPIVRGLGLETRAAVLIGGDSTPFSKPHPEPLLAASRQIGQPATACVYVGDDHRDVQAGRAAGMQTLVAAWGYLGQGDPVCQWQADAVIDAPHQLLQWLEVA